MSLSDGGTATRAIAAGQSRLGRRLAVAVAAVCIVAAALALIAWAAGQAAAPPPPKSPFGTGLREAAPTGSFGALILALQSQFYQALTQGLQVIAETGTGLWTLMGIGFAYGVFHAAGPGHGKGVISGYLLANEQTLAKGFVLSLAAAVLQALVAIAIVAVLAVVLKATAASVSATANLIELASFALVAVVGAVLLWRKAGKFVAVSAPDGDTAAADDCDHAHMPSAAEVARAGTVRAWIGVVLAAGTRPCSGAIILLVFALSQKAFTIGVAATFAMALGTAITTGMAAALAVFAKGLALRLAGGRGRSGTIAVAGIEVLAGAFVLVLGAALLIGLASAGAG
ncbi:nickel/cobalt transporter [Chelatococcus reniformis]|uniref:Nickel/cobalt efflux system n=1 Tax=Chelatococcus reniformis TaxID=1494448 RepID=A0A916U9P3_9HYPH|nr:nickel transporter [Chelatococcus reniformis]GGC63754.1 hypothetical protein GCM10010994_22910 [Chelatococcus reniformis]